LKEVADACGILPGSLYHHFESKEAIVIELVERYRSQLDSIGNTALELLGTDGPQPAVFEEIVSLSTALADTSLHNRAAMQLTLYEPPAGASRQLAELSRRSPRAVNAAMQEILHRGRVSGFLKPGIDAVVLADEMSETMRHIGLGYLHRGPAEQVALTLCHMLLFGIAAQPPGDVEFDRSTAMRAAEGAAQAWAKPAEPDPGDKAAALRSVARAEFARRGYEATTIRDVAAAARMGTGSVYRIIRSKEALLASIMDSYHSSLSDGYDAVLASDSTTLEKLDALTWLNINVHDRFSQEFAIQQAWLRATPPTIAFVGKPPKQRARQIGVLVAEGFRSGEMRAGHLGPATPPVDMVAACVRDLIWIPGHIVNLLGNRATLRHSRATLFRGAAIRD
jgi:AcrR family transcriptional regulator